MVRRPVEGQYPYGHIGNMPPPPSLPPAEPQWRGRPRDWVAEARRGRISDMLAQGLRDSEILDKEGCGYATLIQDKQIIRAEWQEKRLQSIETHIENETAKLDAAERLVWERIKGTLADTLELPDIPTRKSKKVTIKVQDERLDAVRVLLSIIEMRAKLRGLFGGKKVPIADHVYKKALEAGLSDDEARDAVREVESILKEERVG